MQYGIHEIEVTQPFRPLALRQDDDGAAVLLHRKGRPVAFWLASRGEGAEHWTTVEGLSIEISRRAGEKLLSEQVRDELSALHHENMSRGNNSDPPPHRRSLTIAICTHARTEKLARLLESLRSLKGTWLPNQLEIVVVDNAPPDSRTRDHVHRILAENKPPVGASLRYIGEPRIGLDFARNRALCEARGEWIAFLDDDVVVGPHWITGLDEAWLENPDAVAVTGLVLPLVLETESQILFERYGGFRRGCDKIRFHGPTRPGNPLYPCGAGIFGAGANMAFEVDTLRSLGGFDNALDTGATLPGGGDLDIFYRVIRAGYPLVYEPSMTVRHEHRRDLSGLTAQYESWGKGFMAFIGKSGKTDRALSRRLSRTRIWWWLDTSKQAVLALLGQHPLPLRMVLAAARGGLIGSCGEFGRSQRRVKAIRQSVEADITSDDGDLQRPAEEPARAQPAIRPGGVPTSTKGSEFRPWRIANLQLLDPLPSLAAEANGSGLFLVLWCGDVPLGHLWIAARSLPIPPRRLIAGIAEVIAPALGDHLLSGFREPLPMPPLTRHRKLETPILHELLSLKEPLQLLARTHESTTEQPPSDRCSVSVVVCTRDRPDDLAQCLASLDRLDPKPDEVLVVDNAPERPSTREVVGRHAGVTYVPEPRLGLSVARNTGILHAAGEIIAFTDDDVEVHSNWVAALRRGFASSDVGVVTGLVLPAKLDTPAQVWFQGGEGSHGWSYRKREYDQGYLKQLRHLYVPVWHIGAGANMAFRRDAIDAVGLFDERLGPGKSGGCGEDSEIWYRMLAAGIRCLYFPEAVVYHHHRRHEGQLRSQIRSYQRGHVAALFVQFFNHRHIGNLVRVFLVLPLQLLTQAARSFVFGTTRKAFLVDQCVGHLQGLLEPLKLLSPRWRAAPSSNAVRRTPSK